MMSEFILPATEAAAQAARQWVVATVRPWGVPPDTALAHDLALVVSELVTNAILHSGQDKVGVRIRCMRERLRIEVSDNCRRMPQLQDNRLDDEGGRGLLLVAAIATRCGVDQTYDGKTTWAEFAYRADLKALERSTE